MSGLKSNVTMLESKEKNVPGAATQAAMRAVAERVEQDEAQGESHATTDPTADLRLPTLKVEQPKEPAKEVRVRLLIAMPTLVVLLTTILSYVNYAIAETFFPQLSSPGATPYTYFEIWLVTMLLFNLVGAAVGFAVAYTLSAPIRNLIHMSRRVAGGDFTTKAPTNRADEVGALGSSFNTMVESLNQFFSRRNRFILESFTGGLLTTDMNGTVTAINSSAERMLGLEAGRITGQNAIAILNQFGHQALADMLQECLWKVEPIIARPLHLSFGGHDISVSANCSPMRDDTGRMLGLIVNFRNLAEVEKFYQQMSRADRLATLGTFATGLAHEVRNPLGAIKGAAQLLAEDAPAETPTHRYASIIVKEANRLNNIVREVHDLSQPKDVTQVRADINQIVRHSLMLARGSAKVQAKPGVDIREKLGDMPMASVSQDRLTQALLNLLTNAIQATPETGFIELRTQYSFDDTDPLPLQIVITNTGCTIPAELRERIFEPFFTTKSDGTGLGLPIAYQVVTHHGGDITLDATDDSVTFTVRLPKFKAEPGDK